MKKILIAVIIVIGLIFISSLLSQEFSYVGADKCKICHKTESRGKQYPIWEESKHFQSFKTLSLPEAADIAQEAGVSDPHQSEQCLKCHAPLHEKAPEIKEEGVTCEVCHGPGSEYKKLSVMQTREEAVKMGLTAYNSPQDIKNQCLTCHQNAHGLPFDFDSSWETIKHPVPEK